MEDEVIPILRVGDVAEALSWYQRLGFAQEWEHRFEAGFPAFVSVAREGMRRFLSEHTGDARPDTLVYLRVRDVDEFAAKLGRPVEERPWARARSTFATLMGTACGSARRSVRRPT